LINRIPPTKFLLRSSPYFATAEFLVSILTASFAACLYVHLQQLLQLIQRRKIESQSVNPLETKKERKIESQSVNPLETKKETIIENATTTAAAPWWHHSS
jgi:hypothetical protein